MDTEYYSQYPPGMKMTDGIPGKPFLFLFKSCYNVAPQILKFEMPYSNALLKCLAIYR